MKISQAREIIGKLTEGDQARARKRANLIHTFNGGQPYTESEAETHGIYTNVQSFTGPRILMEARRQLARLHQGALNLFHVTVRRGSNYDDMASRWITDWLNRFIKNDSRYVDKMHADDASLVLHGVAPTFWDDPYEWRPTALAVEDLKIPDNTLSDFSNLTHFAIRQEMSAANLLRIITARRAVPGWNIPLLKRLAEKLLTDRYRDWRDWDINFPEKVADDFRSSPSFFSSTALADVKVWYLYDLRPNGSEAQWYLQVFTEDEKDDDFLYQSPKPVAEDVAQLLQVHYADGSCHAPFKYHSVKGLAYLIYPAVMLLDRAFCRINDVVHDSMNQYYRGLPDPERAGPVHVILPNQTVIPSGIQFVTAGERYTVNANILRFYIDFLRQFISEQATSYTRDIDGDRGAMTATEAQARMAMAGALAESLLDLEAKYREREYREVCRRFTLKKSRDPDVKRFQSEFLARFGDPEFFNFSLWDVWAEHGLGGANTALAMQQANLLFQNRGAFSPHAQKEIRREWILAITNDPRKALAWEPEDTPAPSGTVQFAQLALGALLQGTRVDVPPQVNLLEYALILLDGITQRLNLLAGAGGVPVPADFEGIMTAAMHLEDVLQVLAGDEANRDLVKAMMQQLTQALRPVDEWRQAIERGTATLKPEDQAKIMAIMTKAEAEREVALAKHQQKIANLQERSEQKMAEQQLLLQQELEAKRRQAEAEIAIRTAKARAGMS